MVTESLSGSPALPKAAAVYFPRLMLSPHQGSEGGVGLGLGWLDFPLPLVLEHGDAEGLAVIWPPRGFPAASSGMGGLRPVPPMACMTAVTTPSSQPRSLEL